MRLVAFDRQRSPPNVLVRTILTVACPLRNLLPHILSFDPLTEDGVFPGEPVSICDRDEELRSVGVGTGVRHCEFAGLVEAMRRALRFVLKLISRASHAGALRISALDHEVGNDSVEDGAVV